MWKRLSICAVVAIAACTGDKDEPGADDSAASEANGTTGAAEGATGTWSGECVGEIVQGVSSTSTSAVSFDASATLDLVESGGALSGALVLVDNRTGYTRGYLFEGNRTGDQLAMEGVGFTDTTAGTDVALSLDLEVDGDAIGGDLVFEGMSESRVPCDLAR